MYGSCYVLLKTTGDFFLSLFNEVNIFSKYTNLTYGPLKSKNTYQTKLYTYIQKQDVWET